MAPKIGLIGLGTMGAALSLNIAEKGHRIAVFNRTTSKMKDFVAEAGDLAERITGCKTLEDFVAAIEVPRSIILMVPAGDPVDEQIEKLLPLLGADDLIIDAGNANFHDTNRRVRVLDQPILGIGVSGGEEGARFGPSIMGGGPKAYWDRVEPVLQDIAAKHEGSPCADWMGEEGAGHFVKAVHNGIEYADMQLIAEVYGIMRDGLGMDAAEIGEVFSGWNDGPLQSYLVEISGEVAKATDAKTGGPVLDVILDAAGQKGTGRWTAIEAQHLGAAIPVIEAAVTARNISAQKETRETMEGIFGAAPGALDAAVIPIERLEAALICGKILCYDQGFAMIRAASEKFGWSLDGARIAKVWREGCIIRSAMLDDMASAFEEDAERRLMAAPSFAQKLRETHGALRHVVAEASQGGLQVLALSSALASFDMMRTGRGTANMIQGQRDFFGRHGFVRMDNGEEGSHGPWAD